MFRAVASAWCGASTQVGQGEARGELAADLLGERVAVLDRRPARTRAPAHLGEVDEVGERERVRAR